MPPSRTKAPRPEPAELEHLLADEREALQRLFPLPAPAAPGRRRRRPAVPLAAALGVGALAAALVALDPPYGGEHHLTATGERRTVALADGSTVTLDSGTALRLSWHLRSRRAVLEQGRAAFAVAPAVLRPFEADAGRFGVRVVGTVFDLERRGDTASVTLSEGRVRVVPADGGGATELAPGQRLSARAGQAPFTAAVDLQRTGAWREGRLVFERTPLAEALTEIGRYRSEPLRVPDAQLGALEVSGVFDAANTGQILELLPRILPVRVVHRADGGIDVVAR